MAAAAALAIAVVEAPPAQATYYKLYRNGNPTLCLALDPAHDRLVFVPADSTDLYQKWEVINMPDGSFVLFNRHSGRRIKNAHASPLLLDDAAYFHPGALGSPARFEMVQEQYQYTYPYQYHDDGSTEVQMDGNTLRHRRFAMKIWGNDDGDDQPGNFAGDDDDQDPGAEPPAVEETVDASTSTTSTRKKSRSGMCGCLYRLFA